MLFSKSQMFIILLQWILIYNIYSINSQTTLPDNFELNTSNTSISENFVPVTTCPGECIHVITSLLCDQVLEDIPCISAFFRCCITKEPFYGTPIETSPPLFNDENEDNSFTSSTIVPNQYESLNLVDKQNDSNKMYINTNINLDRNVSHDYTYSLSLDINNSSNFVYSTLPSFSNKFSSPFIPLKFSTNNTPFLLNYPKNNITSLSQLDLVLTTTTSELRTSTLPSIVDTKTSNSILNTSLSITNKPIFYSFKCPGICMNTEYARYCGNIMTNDQLCEQSKICCIQSDHKLDSNSNFTTNKQNYSNEFFTENSLIDESNDKKNTTESNKDKNHSTEVVPNNDDKQLNNKQLDYSNSSSIVENSNNLPPCEENCVTLLFSLLCDEIDNDKFCPNEGKCCKYKDGSQETTSVILTTTTPSTPTIGPCLGTCIPTILSGVCNRPSELILKTTTCIIGMICCYTPMNSSQNNKFQSLSSSDNDSNEPNTLINNSPSLNSYLPTYSLINKRFPIHQLSVLKKPSLNSPSLLNPSYSSLNWQKFLATQNQQIPLYKPLSANSQLISFQPVINNNLRPNSFFNSQSAVTQSSSLDNYQPPIMNSFHSTSNTNKLLSNLNQNNSILSYLSNFPCPGSCISSLFKFTCFGNNVIYSHFSCSKPQQLCCASLTNIDIYENVLDLVANETLFPMANNFNKINQNLYNNQNLMNYLNMKNNYANNNFSPNKNYLNTLIANTNYANNYNNLKTENNNKINNIKNYPSIKPSVVSIRKPLTNQNRLPLNLEVNSQSSVSSSIPVYTSHLANSIFNINENSNATNNNNYINIALHQAEPEETNNLPKLSTCGIVGQQDTGRVVGGSESKPNKWCWQVALINQQNQYLCGGALIGTQWILTAAHCITSLVRNGKPIFIRVGEYDLTKSQSKEFDSESVTQLVITTYIHHNHNSETLENDIALIKIQQPLQLKNNICLVCLPTRGSTVQSGKKCIVTGYGYVSEDGPASLKIREASISIINDRQCTKKINSVTEKKFILPTSSFCAGGEEENDACQGDGGGPFVCEEDGFYELTGLVSWGFGCGRQNVPAVYVKVSSFIGWINQIISVNN